MSRFRLGWGGGGQGRCEQRSEVFLKIQKKVFLVGHEGVRTQRCCCRGGGALKAEVLNRAAKAAREGGMRGGLNPPLIRGQGGLPRKFL